MKLKANDTLHVSSVKPDNLAPGEEFEVEDAVGKSLVDRGLASAMKAAAAPANKMEPAPENKSDPLDHDGDGRKGGSPKGPTATRRRKG